MSYLLDTHAAIWTLFDEKRLPQKTRLLIEDHDTEIFVSAATFWEISLKYALGRLELNGVTPEELPREFMEEGFKLLELSIEDVSSFYKLEKMEHHDPFDRMLIWQAIIRDLTLISKDAELKAYKKHGLKLLWK